MIGCCRGGESRARRGREEGRGTCYNATHEAVVANGNEQDDRRKREKEAGWMLMFASKTRKCSVITTWIGSDDNANRARGFNVEMDQINELPEKYHHGMLMV